MWFWSFDVEDSFETEPLTFFTNIVSVVNISHSLIVMKGDVGGPRDDSDIPEHSATFVRQAQCYCGKYSATFVLL